MSRLNNRRRDSFSKMSIRNLTWFFEFDVCHDRFVSSHCANTCKTIWRVRLKASDDNYNSRSKNRRSIRWIVDLWVLLISFMSLLFRLRVSSLSEWRFETWHDLFNLMIVIIVTLLHAKRTHVKQFEEYVWKRQTRITIFAQKIEDRLDESLIYESSWFHLWVYCFVYELLRWANDDSKLDMIFSIWWSS